MDLILFSFFIIDVFRGWIAGGGGRGEGMGYVEFLAGILLGTSVLGENKE